MQKILYIFIATLCLSCINDDVEEETITRNNISEVKQTTIMYFLGTSLKYRYFDVYNIPDTRLAVAAGALGSEGRLLVFMPEYSSSATLYEIYRDNDGYATEIVMSYDTNTSVDETRMADVIAAAQEFAPAESYNIIFSGHGTAWVLSTHSSLRSLSATDDDVNWDNMWTGDIVTKYMGSSSDGYMNIETLSSVLEATNTKYGYLLFDMCLMSNIETLYELKDVCDNVIASPSEVMADGFPYQTVLPALFSNDGASADYEAACYAYYDEYLNYNSVSSATVAWCVTSKLTELAEAMKSINNKGVNDVNINNIQCYENLSTNIFCDLKEYVEAACSDEALFEDFEMIFDEAFPIVGRYSTNSFYSALRTDNGEWIDIDYYSGVSTSEPSTKYPAEWSATSWAEATAKDSVE